MLKITRWLIALVVLFTGSAAAGNSQDLEVGAAWASATIGPTRISALYFVIRNRNNRTERLTGAEAPVADSVEFHFNIRDGDVLRMRGVSAIEIPPGETLVMRQGLYTECSSACSGLPRTASCCPSLFSSRRQARLRLLPTCGSSGTSGLDA